MWKRGTPSCIIEICHWRTLPQRQFSTLCNIRDTNVNVSSMTSMKVSNEHKMPVKSDTETKALSLTTTETHSWHFHALRLTFACKFILHVCIETLHRSAQETTQRYRNRTNLVGMNFFFISLRFQFGFWKENSNSVQNEFGLKKCGFC